MNLSRSPSLLLVALLVSVSIVRNANAKALQNDSQTLDHSNMLKNNVQRTKVYDQKKSLTNKNADPTKYYDEHKENGSTLCPCHLNSAQGSRCYDFMNQAAGTCRMRPCTDGFVCSSRNYATHYCFEKTKHVTKVVSIGGGRCKTSNELLTFRVPYVDIVPRGDEREKELNYNTLIRDDVHDLEPQACYA